MKLAKYGVVAASCALLLTACGSDKSSSSSAVSDVTASTSSTVLQTTTSAAAASGSVAVSGTITDDALGNTVSLQHVVRNFPIPDQYSAIKDSTEIVLVEVKATAGSQYYGVVGSSEFYLNANGSRQNSTTIVDDQMTTAGYPPLKDVSTGKTGTGWVAFTVKPKSVKTLDFAYERLGYSVSGTKTTVPAKTFTLPLTK